MNLLLEFDRNDLSNARDKLLQDIETIKSGHSLEMGHLQTRWMTAIGEYSELILICFSFGAIFVLVPSMEDIVK